MVLLYSLLPGLQFLMKPDASTLLINFQSGYPAMDRSGNCYSFQKGWIKLGQISSIEEILILWAISKAFCICSPHGSLFTAKLPIQSIYVILIT